MPLMASECMLMASECMLMASECTLIASECMLLSATHSSLVRASSQTKRYLPLIASNCL